MQFRVAIFPLFSPFQFSKIVETTFCTLQHIPIWKQKNESGRGADTWLAGWWIMGETQQGRRPVDQKPPVFLRLGLYILESDWVREGRASASCGTMGSSPNLCAFIISSLKEAPEIDDLSGLFQLTNSPYLRGSVMQGAHSSGIGLHRPLPLLNCITAVLPRVIILPPPRAPTPPSFPSQNVLV